jgi:hypothetical protein
MIDYDLCTSLIVKGSDFESGTPEQFDIKNAIIKYTTTIDVEGTYISPDEAQRVLDRAAYAHRRELFPEAE